MKRAKSAVGKKSVPRRYHVGARRALRLAAGSASFALLLACAAPPAAPPLRDPAAPLGATARFDAAAFAGEWRIAASSDARLAGPLRMSDMGGALRIEGAFAGSYTLDAPGVLSRPGAPRLVVMWVDEEFRTAALGTEDGSRAALMVRALPMARDKRAAAVEVLDFYGWDTARMEDRL